MWVRVMWRLPSFSCTLPTAFTGSTDLQTWLPGCSYSGTNRVTTTVQTSEFSRSGAGLETIAVRDNTPISNAPQHFLRLRISQP